MHENSRRDFLRKSAAAVTGLAGAGLARPESAAAQPQARALDAELLAAVAAVALPSELGDAGRARVVAAFQAWLAGFEPVAEQAHGYGTHEITYGPPDPAPQWQSQLRALDLEARRRHDAPFPRLAAEERAAMVRREVAREPRPFPEPLQAQHVAAGLMAFYFSSSEAVDRAYQARIGQYQCRGLATAPAPPPPLEREG